MKKALIYSLALAAMFNLCSCGKQLNDAPQSDSGKAISFDNVATKAEFSDIKNGGFGVWAVIDNSEVRNHVLMNNQYVEYKGGKWTYSPLRYWVPETEFNFIATYPYDSEGLYYTFDSNNSALKLAVTKTPSQVDYLIATNTVDTSDESFDGTKAVNLDFQHILTSVGMKIWRDGGKHQNDDIRITKVTLSNIRKDGTYSSNTDQWTLSNQKLTLEKIYEGGSDTIGAAQVNDNGTLTTGGVPADPFGDVMLIPQTLDASMVSLKILYELKRQNAVDWEQAELETFLPNVTWEANRRYTYNVVLSSVTDITIYYLQTKVDPWGTPQVGGTVIIK